MGPPEGADHRGHFGSNGADEPAAPLESPAATAPPPPPRNGVAAPNRRRPRQPPPESKIGWRRQERIRLAALSALQRRAKPKGGGQSPATPTSPNTLTFEEPPGILPPEVRRHLQGDVMPQVTPSMMRQLSWPVGRLHTIFRLAIYSFRAVKWS